MAGKRIFRRWFGLAYWPHDVLGWLRIPSMIAGITGFLGILKYVWPLASRLLKPLNLPPVEICSVMLVVSGAVYLLCLIGWWFSEDITRMYGGHRENNSAGPGQWRSL